MPVDDFHRDVAVIALRAAGKHGFALGGGNALIAHGIVSRPTEDVDLFTNEDDGVKAAAGAVGDALQEAGYAVERRDLTGGLAEVFDGMGDGLAEWIVTGPGGAQMMLQMAYFDRGRRPVTMDVGPVPDLPVLHLEDVIGSKVCALASRVEPRDYVDTAAALQRYTVDELITLAKRLDPGLEDRDFADVGRQLDRMPDQLFARYGLDPQNVARLRERFGNWPRTLCDPPPGSTRHPPPGIDGAIVMIMT
jgi:Nucleotidyl transferase AbiEii toxin, Type IV TA system